MAGQGPQCCTGLRVKLVGGYVVRDRRSRRVAFLARLIATARPGRPKAAFPGHAPRLAVAALRWPPACGPVPAFAGTASVAALPRRRGTPARSHPPAVTVTAPAWATGTFTARLAAAISAASLPHPVWAPTCVPRPAAVAVSVIAPPYGPRVPACGLWTASPVRPGVTGPSRSAGPPACRPLATFPALAGIALGP
jgi:hypothetical protein